MADTDVTGLLLDRARSGDGEAFAELAGPFRRELQAHCYRILGSVADAEDMLQETLTAAWRGVGRFEGRASLRTWLHTIATNKCLNHLRAARALPAFPPPGLTLPEPSRRAEPRWLEPCPDAVLGELPDTAPGPEARYEARESVSLAFVAALQHLPPRQRAALVLRDVLGFRAAETAVILDCTVDAANNLLKRARSSMTACLPSGRDQAPLPGSAREQQVTARFADAFERGDVPAIIGLLTDDGWLTMPPLPFEYQGRDRVGHFLSVVTFRPGSPPSRMIPVRANGQPAFCRYLRDPHAPVGHAHSLIVLALEGDRISAMTGFLDHGLLSRFGLPRTLPD